MEKDEPSIGARKEGQGSMEPTGVEDVPDPDEDDLDDLDGTTRGGLCVNACSLIS